MSTNFDSSTPLAYTGLSQTANPPTISVNRMPTVNDWQSFNPGDLWRDTSTSPPTTYLLASVQGNVAIWQALGAFPPGAITTINTIGPDLSGNFTIVPGASISITPGVNSITIASIGGNVSSVSGTAHQIDVSPTIGDCIVSIDPTYTGQISINTLGTVATGTWHGTLVAGQYGGTGVANTGLTINLGAASAGDVLTSDGSGNATWQAPTGAGCIKSVVRQTFVYTGSPQVYTPSAGMIYADIECVGGGGGGGGCVATPPNLAAVGGSGGGGGYVKKIVSAATIGASQAVIVGAGGTAGTGLVDAGNGGTSSVGAIVSATGGGFGQRAASAISPAGGGGGLSGTGIGGDINSIGNGGGSGFGTGTIGVIVGPGGGSMWGGAARGTGAFPGNSYPGTNGYNYGGGGSAGSSVSGASAQPGGAGGPGLVVITEYCS